MSSVMNFLNLESPPYGKSDTVQAGNLIEKLILYRLLKLLRLNIQFLFVFDGANRPRGKRGKHGGGGVQWKEITLLKNLLKQLGVAQHMAPGEAKAECAALQRHGVVDTVWSEDCDCLMFGCTTLIRDFREGGKKSETKVRIYRAELVKEKVRLDREGLVAFAMLNGGDYDSTGLRGCGPKLAIQAARRGLGQSLCDALDQGISMGRWRSELVEFLREQRKPLEIPPNYPSVDKARLYHRPLVSRPHQLTDLNCLRNGWDLEIDEANLREHLRNHFNFFTKEYMKHITPVLLARSLASADPGGRAFVHRYDVQPAKRSKKETEEAAKSSTKISFKPAEVTCIDVGESVAMDLGMERQRKDPPYDPDERVECELLNVILKRAFPNQDFNAPPIKQRKNAKKKYGDDPNSKGWNIKSQNKDRNKRKSSELHSSDDLDRLVEKEPRQDRPTKRPRGRRKESDITAKALADRDETTLQSLDVDQAVRDLSPGSDLPDLDDLLHDAPVLVPLSPNATRKGFAPYAQVEKKAKNSKPTALIKVTPKCGFSDPIVGLVDLTGD
ncbi:MAG: hypothetical protein Q9157_004017 [Trypethelium eluteriae]